MQPGSKSPDELVKLIDRMQRLIERNILPEINELKANIDQKLEDMDIQLSGLSIPHNNKNKIIIASNIIADAMKIATKKGLDRCAYREINVQDPAALGALVEEADIVISYIPAFLHIHVAKSCLAHKKHMVTSSYVSPQLAVLDAEAKSLGLIFLNELGLDPGIDHLTTMRTIHEVYSKGGRILEYESWCGGLPSPASCDNPLGYKFTWSPIGAIRALNNKAKFISGNNVIEIDAKDVQYHLKRIQFNRALTMEGYPNRDSLSYKDIYSLKDATKVLRGTLRYEGFCEIFCGFKEIGLLQEVPCGKGTWVEVIEGLIGSAVGTSLPDKLRHVVIDQVVFYKNLSQEQKNTKFSEFMKVMKYFSLLDPKQKVADPQLTLIENLVKQLQKRLALRPGDTDLIAMQHIFTIELNGHRSIRRSSLVLIGNHDCTAMALTVGTPAAIGAQLILDGHIRERGVLRPMSKEIYVPVLAELEKMGIRFLEEEEQI